MADTRLDDWLWRWSAWCLNGTTGRNVTSWLRERNTGKRINAAFEFDADCMEYRIELSIGKLAKENILAARVLRWEYQIRPAKSTQADRAIALDMPLRTYKLRLKQARDFVDSQIFGNAK